MFPWEASIPALIGVVLLQCIIICKAFMANVFSHNYNL